MTDTKKNGEKYKLSHATRRRMAAAQRKRFGAKRSHRRQEVSDASSNAAPIEEGTFSYALGFIECWLQTYAAAAGVPHGALTARVGKVLQVKARG